LVASSFRGGYDPGVGGESQIGVGAQHDDIAIDPVVIDDGGGGSGCAPQGQPQTVGAGMSVNPKVVAETLDLLEQVPAAAPGHEVLEVPFPP